MWYLKLKYNIVYNIMIVFNNKKLSYTVVKYFTLSNINL